MTYIESKIQDGYMTRRGWRGRWLTVYRHDYGGKPEKSERFHVHPWRWAISIVVKGFIHDSILSETGSRGRYPYSISVYRQSTSHRIIEADKKTVTLFIGIFRTQEPTHNADVKVKEGYCHYTELGGDIDVSMIDDQ